MVRTWLTLLVSFDFSKCVFETMPLPDVYTVGEFNLRLALFKENVACIEQQFGEKYDCNVWVMNEYGVKESWYKLCTVKLDQYNYPIGFSKKGEIICKKGDYKEDEEELWLCDPVTKELQSLPMQPLEQYFKIAVYKESLVSIKSLNGETNIVHFNSVVEPCDFAGSNLEANCVGLQQ
ncbi:hypothetical protein AQUCO_02700044v1 [Aquilegia coerulea]|uniref:F-box associated beta-propeller type 1 domain-containing protein n=1 Tax=Aquilegia coerulea TaxID=218851 RepID=A0A2G5D4W5_AQUCA|nr:hypothetical protein AQUCO_02700044v1 [Aquilegia coerulea]